MTRVGNVTETLRAFRAPHEAHRLGDAWTSVHTQIVFILMLETADNETGNKASVAKRRAHAPDEERDSGA
jgi:hypothetical protein